MAEAGRWDGLRWTRCLFLQDWREKNKERKGYNSSLLAEELMPTHLGFRWEVGDNSPVESEGSGEGVDLVEAREVTEAKMYVQPK